MLPVYCQDGKRRYDPAGFKPESIMVTPEDARDFMRDLDEPGLLRDIGGLRFVAARSSCFQNIFREGAKSKTPRTITLWIEPVITFAGLARLHLDLEWPKECLGTESKKWEFDLVAHWPPKSENEHVAVGVKKTVAELEELLMPMERLRCARQQCGEPPPPPQASRPSAWRYSTWWTQPVGVTKPQSLIFGPIRNSDQASLPFGSTRRCKVSALRRTTAPAPRQCTP